MLEKNYLSNIKARDVASLDLKINAQNAMATLRSLEKLGISMDSAALKKVSTEGMGMDALIPTQTTGAIPVLVQFLQAFMPGMVHVATAARQADELMGVMTAGSWESEQVVQIILEYGGTAVPYGDYTNVPFASWNPNLEQRTIVRFEEGLKVGRLEEARAAAMNINTAQEKRNAAIMALDIQRNAIGFFGYNGGNNRTYGFLNDPNLPAYVTVAASGTGATTTWATKTMLQIEADIRAAAAQLQLQSNGVIDPSKDAMTLGIPTALAQYLTVGSDYGYSVRKWINENYPNMRIVTAPQFNGANGGSNVFYLYADGVNDGSTDGGQSIVQIVPTRFKLLGVEQKAKGYIEDYSNAAAGVMVKRPWAVVRYSGI